MVSGVRTKTYLVLAYVVCSILAAVSGLALTAQIGSGQAVDQRAADARKHRGRRDCGGEPEGRRRPGRDGDARRAFFLLILTDAMDLLRIDPRIQTIFLGLIVVLAVAAGGDRQAEDVRCLTSALASSDAAQRRGLLGWLLVFSLPLLMIVHGAVGLRLRAARAVASQHRQHP